MERSTKLIIGIGSVLLIGAGVGLYFYNKSQDEGSDKEDKDDKEKDLGSNDVTDTSDGYTSGSYPSYSPSASSSVFKNATEGNKFRAWVNSKYPSYARSINLDPTGAYDNSYIKQAFAKYGDEYMKATTPVATNVNFTQLLKNSGLKANKDNIAIAKFNGGKNTAQFYINNRVVIFNANKQMVLKGVFSNGGKTITIDGKPPISSGSVWVNLENILK